MRLRGKMHDGVNMVGLEDVAHKVCASNVALDKGEIGCISDTVEVAQRGAIVQRVVCNDLFVRGVVSMLC